VEIRLKGIAFEGLTQAELESLAARCVSERLRWHPSFCGITPVYVYLVAKITGDATKYDAALMVSSSTSWLFPERVRLLDSHRCQRMIRVFVLRAPVSESASALRQRESEMALDCRDVDGQGVTAAATHQKSDQRAIVVDENRT
jgi:hypothetical protein